MNQRCFILLACLCIVACKENPVDPPPPPPEPATTAEKLSTILNLQTGATEKFIETFSIAQDTVASIDAVGQWLLDQPEVGEVWYWSLQTVEVRFVNGLKSFFSVVFTDANGQHLSRGGGGGGVLKTFGISEEEAEEEIGNKKVLVLNPYVEEFYNNNYTKESIIESASAGLEATVINGHDVTYDVFSTFGDYGCIIINTHGLPHGFMFRQLIDAPGNHQWTAQEVAELLAQDGLPIEKFENEELELDVQLIMAQSNYVDKVVVVATELFIRNGPFTLDRTVVFGNYCYSGHTAEGPLTNNVSEAFRSKGAITYYGYAHDDGSSSKVNNLNARDMEDSIIANLMNDKDTTGVAHLANDLYEQQVGIDGYLWPQEATRGLTFQPVIHPQSSHPLLFRQFFETNYSYEGCVDSIIDLRDGEVYETVCIGGQVWMAENLRFDTAGSLIAHNDPSKLATHGRLYDYPTLSRGAGPVPENQISTIRGICPEGWHLPSLYEWEQLISNVGFGTNNDFSIRIKSPNDWVGDPDISHPERNTTGFSALPSGLAHKDIPSGNIDYVTYNEHFLMWLCWTEPGCGVPYFTKEINIDNQPANVGGLCVPTNPYGGWTNVDYNSCRCVKD